MLPEAGQVTLSEPNISPTFFFPGTLPCSMTFPLSFPQRLFPFPPLSNVMIQLGVEFLTKHLLGPQEPLRESLILRYFGVDCSGNRLRQRKGWRCVRLRNNCCFLICPMEMVHSIRKFQLSAKHCERWWSVGLWASAALRRDGQSPGG